MGAARRQRESLARRRRSGRLDSGTHTPVDGSKTLPPGTEPSLSGVSLPSSQESLSLDPETELSYENIQEILGDVVTVPFEQLRIGEEVDSMGPGKKVLRRGPHQIEFISALGSGAMGSAWKARMRLSGFEEQAREVIAEIVDPAMNADGEPNSIAEAIEASGDMDLRDLLTEEQAQELASAEYVVKMVPLKDGRLGQNEVRELIALSRNHLLFDAWVAQNAPGEAQALVMEIALQKGPNKRAYMEELKELSPEERVSDERVAIALQGLEGILTQLLVSAKRGVQHRDVKPANIQVNDHNNRLVDFGIAKLIDQEDNEQGVAGTPRYMTPKTVSGEPDPIADVVAALAVANQELDTATPRRAGTIPELLMNVYKMNTWEIKDPRNHPGNFNGRPSEELADLFRMTQEGLPESGAYYNPFGPGTPFHDHIQKLRKKEAHRLDTLRDRDAGRGGLRLAARDGKRLLTHEERVARDDRPDANGDAYTKENMVMSIRNVLYYVHMMRKQQMAEMQAKKRAAEQRAAAIGAAETHPQVAPVSADRSTGADDPNKTLPPRRRVLFDPDGEQ